MSKVGHPIGTDIAVEDAEGLVAVRERDARPGCPAATAGFRARYQRGGEMWPPTPRPPLPALPPFSLQRTRQEVMAEYDSTPLASEYGN